MQQHPPGGAVIAKGPLADLKEMREALVRGGVEAQIVRPPAEHCGT